MTSDWISKFAVIVTLFFPLASHADWTELGAQYRCDARRSLVSFMAYEQNSSDYRTAVPRGYRVLPTGDYTLTCRTQTGTIRSTLRILPASPGECMGSGAVLISAIVTRGKNIIAGESTRLNFQCVFSDYYLSRLNVKLLKQSAVVTRCISHVFRTTNELGCADESVALP